MVLPKLAASRYDRKPDLVVRTRLDLVFREYLTQYLSTVGRMFWPKDRDENRVLKCSSHMGLSANHLLEQSETIKPSFEGIWHPNSIGYHVSNSFVTSSDHLRSAWI